MDERLGVLSAIYNIVDWSELGPNWENNIVWDLHDQILEVYEKLKVVFLGTTTC